MIGLVAFSELSLGWSDPIPWSQLGILTASRPTIWNQLLLLVVCSMAFHFVLFRMCEWVFESHGRFIFAKDSQYWSMPPKLKKEHYSRVVSDLHAVLSAYAGLYTAYYSCEDTTQTMFSSSQCANSVTTFCLYACAYSIGYIFVDLYVCYCEIQYTWKEGMEIYLHHTVGNFGGLVSLTTGYLWPNIAISVMVAELSTPILNMRWRLLKHKMTDTAMFTAANVGFATMFFISRCVFMPQLSLLVWRLWSSFPFLQMHPVTYTGFLVGSVCLLFLQLLQFYWMALILNSLYKSMTGQHKKSAKQD